MDLFKLHFFVKAATGSGTAKASSWTNKVHFCWAKQQPELDQSKLQLWSKQKGLSCSLYCFFFLVALVRSVILWLRILFVLSTSKRYRRHNTKACFAERHFDNQWWHFNGSTCPFNSEKCFLNKKRFRRQNDASTDPNLPLMDVLHLDVLIGCQSISHCLRSCWTRLVSFCMTWACQPKVCKAGVHVTLRVLLWLCTTILHKPCVVKPLYNCQDPQYNFTYTVDPTVCAHMQSKIAY